jgi:hypothetical protein
VSNPFLIQELANLQVEARVIALPKRAERIICRITRFGGFRCDDRPSRHFIDELDLAIRATRKPLSILSFALWAEHVGVKKVYYTMSNHYIRPLSLFSVSSVLSETSA